MVRCSSVVMYIAAWSAACGPAVSAAGKEGPSPKPDARMAQAQAIVDSIKPLEYRDPADGSRIAKREKAAELYRQVCVATHEVSPCVWTISLSLAADTDGAVPRIVDASTLLGAACLKDPRSDACRIFDDVQLSSNVRYYADAKGMCEKGL